MRTTLNLDADLLRAAKALAQARDVSVGTVISELARKGLAAAPRGRTRNGLPLFPVAKGARPITLEDVKKAEDLP